MEEYKKLELPTSKQISYAKTLAKKNKVELPKSYTKKAYSAFIYKYKNNYNHSEPFDVWAIKNGY